MYGTVGWGRTLLPVEISPEYLFFFLIRLVIRTRKAGLVRKPEEKHINNDKGASID
jgi:hypothetical protein